MWLTIKVEYSEIDDCTNSVFVQAVTTSLYTTLSVVGLISMCNKDLCDSKFVVLSQGARCVCFLKLVTSKCSIFLIRELFKK